jgi:hypothetical protein
LKSKCETSNFFLSLALSRGSLCPADISADISTDS